MRYKRNCECLDCTHFCASSSKYGFHSNELDFLPKPTKRKILRLIARISERSYRRGVQQALVLKEDNNILPEILDCLWKWRYKKNIDTSYGLRGNKSTSLERLEMEENLHDIGLWP